MKTKPKRVVRHSPPTNITLLPLIKLEAKRQAKRRNITLSRHISMLIEKESAAKEG